MVNYELADTLVPKLIGFVDNTNLSRSGIDPTTRRSSVGQVISKRQSDKKK